MIVGSRTFGRGPVPGPPGSAVIAAGPDVAADRDRPYGEKDRG
ncbi:hypothetical protein [Actinoallomurus iriomotensis]|nr:hypothetical protein [Actinoallomurus iriomotensis]